ncbi:MAG: tRNA (N6-isopentenyl adenosine(37)-C2)-methylthiotransferase MiaB [Candidatus Aceula meridiana]|nr:tRNA (N6-isopentenyl adenosine(37)-C2)-methylthiotransferase MiaB [Candidatus Aceula meridiana]
MKNMDMRNNIFLKTFGCQMNEYDSELIRSILSEKGYTFTESEQEADIIMLNTCSVRETASRKIIELVNFLRHQLNGKPTLIGILGCMATDQKLNLLGKKSKVDFIAGPDSYQKLPELIEIAKTKKQSFDFELSKEIDYDGIYPTRKKGVNAWLAIMRGCDNFCTFCIVPYTRGRERSRSPQSILKEARKLAAEGFPQVTLLGQNVNSYHAGDYNFPRLIKEVSAIKGIKRIRFMSPNPKDFPNALVETIASSDNICKHVHLPLQSGSSRILDLMNRTYSKENFLTLVSQIRKTCPNIAITTDIIVGFPTETDEDFVETLDVLKKVRFDAAFTFKYSQRSGTIAQKKFKDDISPDVKKERIIALNKIQRNISLEENQKCIGKTVEALVEEEGTEKECRGRTDSFKIVSFNEKRAVGDFVKIKIHDASFFGLRGKLVD